MKRNQHVANMEREKIVAEQYANSLKKLES